MPTTRYWKDSRFKLRSFCTGAPPPAYGADVRARKVAWRSIYSPRSVGTRTRIDGSVQLASLRGFIGNGGSFVFGGWPLAKVAVACGLLVLVISVRPHNPLVQAR